MTKDENGLPELPQGWMRPALGEIAHINYRDPAIRDLPDDLPVTFVPMAAVDADSGTIAQPQVRPLAKVRKGYTPFSDGDVLFAKITPCMENGKAAIAESLMNGRGFGSTEFHVLKPGSGIMPEWLLYFVRKYRFRMEAKASFAGTAGQLRVPVSFLQEYPIPIAPTSEQQRIVAKIEELFTQLDAGVATLEKAKAQLRRYRQAVLKAAVEGELTREWREAHRGELEPASVLLERITDERRRKGEKIREALPLDTSGLPELPEEWVWTNVSEIGEVIGGLTKNSKRKACPLQMPYLRVANVYAGELRLDDVETIGVEENELKRLLLREGDLLVVEGNGSIDQIGRVALWDGSISPCVHQNHIIKVRFNPVELGEYVLYWLLSNDGREQITRVASSTSGLYTLSLSKVSALPTPLPPLSEQRKIVEEIERCLSVADEMEKALEQSLKRAERLRQSILKRAFEGKLVPQDPSDEPASALLARIRAEKARREVEEKAAKGSHKKASQRSRKKGTPGQLKLL